MSALTKQSCNNTFASNTFVCIQIEEEIEI